MPDDTRKLTSGEQSLDDLLAQVVAAEEADRPVDRQLLLAEHPQNADELREFFANRDAMQYMAAPIRGAVSPAATRTANGHALGKVRYFGDYELVEEIAAGGMGIVYKARQVSLNRVVAVKMILKGTLASEDDVKRFRAEAEAAANLQHPGIVAIHEVGLHEGQHYFSMDFVEGQSLAQLPREQPLSAKQAAEYVRDAAEAVHYAHQQGTLHRDLKPSNILIDRQGRVRITDFGLAKRIADNSDLTLTGQILGTPSYMPPEQALSKRSLIGTASDVYSLGAVLYELLTGRPPFRGESPGETLRQVETLDPVSPHLLNPATPRDLQTICLMCLEKEPHKRYLTAQHLADDLCRFLSAEPILARPISRPARAWRWCRRNPVVAGLSGAVTLLLFLVGVVVTVAIIRLKDERDTISRQKTAIEQQSLLIQRESSRVTHAERIANERLFKSLLASAQASRLSRRAGQRLSSLKAIVEAAQLAVQLELGPEAREQLRDDFLAGLSLIDLATEREWTIPQTDWYVAFDDPLERYAAKGPQGVLSLRRVSDDHELFALPSPGGSLERRGFSPDGKWLAALYAENKFVLWDTTTGQPRSTIDSVTDFSFAASSGSIALVRGARIEIYQIDTWEKTAPIPERSKQAVAWSPDGIHVAVATGNVLEIWDIAAKSMFARFYHPVPVRGVMAWRPDGRFIAAPCGDYNIYVWDLELKRERTVLRGHANEGMEVFYSHDGSLLASHSWDGTTRIWDPLLGRELVRIQGLVRQFSADDRQLAYNDGARQVGIWDLVGNEERRILGAFNYPQHQRVTNCIDINSDGSLLAASGGDGVMLWELPSARPLGLIPLANPGSVQFDWLGRIIVPGDKTLRAIKLDRVLAGTRDTGETDDATFGKFADAVGAAIVSPSGGLALAREDSSTAVFVDLKSARMPQLRFKHAGLNHKPSGMAICPDGYFAVTAPWNGRGLKVWDLRKRRGTLLKELWPEAVSVCVAFSPDGRTIAATNGAELRTWQVGSWKQQLRLPRRAGNLAGPVAFSPNSQILAFAVSRQAIQLFDCQAGQPFVTIEPPDLAREAVSIAFTPDSKLLAIGYSDSVELWDLVLIRQRLRASNLDWELQPRKLTEGEKLRAALDRLRTKKRESTGSDSGPERPSTPTTEQPPAVGVPSSDPKE